MKNKVLMLSLVTFLTGCNVKTFLMEKIEINLAIYNTYQVLKWEEINEKIKLKENFILYIFSPYCDTCNDFKNMINTYIYKYNSEIFALNINDGVGNITYKSTPTILIFNKGKEYLRADIDNEYKIFYSYSRLSSFLNSNIRVKSYRNLYDEISLYNVMNFENSIIYYYYSKCSDCMYFYDNYLSNFLKNTNYKFYGFEMEKYFANIDLFYDFCDRLNLSDKGDGFGYLNGVVPMFQKYKNSSLVDECVIYNDSFVKQISDYGEVISMKLISSYYNDNPFVGHIFQGESPKNMYHKETLSFFYDKFNLFLSNYT